MFLCISEEMGDALKSDGLFDSFAVNLPKLLIFT